MILVNKLYGLSINISNYFYLLDSIIFLHDDNEKLPLEIAPFIGCLTCEITEAFGVNARCVGFVGLGAKSYSLKIQVQGKSGYEYVIKHKGVNLTGAKSLLSFDIMKDLLDPTHVLSVDQTQFKRDLVTPPTYVKFKKNIKRTFSKRIPLADISTSVPFGFCQDFIPLSDFEKGFCQD